jgi:hypothetical protein
MKVNFFPGWEKVGVGESDQFLLNRLRALGVRKSCILHVFILFFPNFLLSFAS